MEYNKEIIEKRTFKIKLIKKLAKKFIYILAIVCIYNAFLITKSALDDNASKELFGYKAYIITTDSMKPSVRKGDAIIVEKCAQEKLNVEDIVTIRNAKDIIITHRIIDIKENTKTGEKEYVTKGDNNNVEDPEVISYNQIEGKKVLVIPFFGHLLLSFKNKMYVIILTIVIGLIVMDIVSKQKKKEMRREKKKNEDSKAKEEPNNSNDS